MKSALLIIGLERGSHPQFAPAWQYLESRSAWSRITALSRRSWATFAHLSPAYARTSHGIQHEVTVLAGALAERFVAMKRDGDWT